MVAPSPLRVLAAPSLAVLALVLAGCTYTAPMETTRSMIPGDGRNFTLSPGVEVSSALIVSGGEGEPGVLVASIVNDGEEAASVSITGAGIDEDVDVPVGRTASIGGVDQGSQEVVIDSVPQAPGYLVPLTFSTGDGAAQEVALPVLDGTFPEYEPYLASLDED